jgi:hypothetical protein
MNRTLLLLALVPGLAFAASKDGQTDPLEKPINKYQEQIKGSVARQYAKYEKVTQPRPEVPPLARPEERLDRLTDIELLGALPSDWIKTLNTKGDEAQQKGTQDGPDKPVPDEFKDHESRYVGEEPSGNALRSAEEWAKGAAEGDPDAVKPPYDELARLQKKGGDVKADAYQKVAKATESQFKARVRGSVAKALKALKGAVQPLAAKAAKPDPSQPWAALSSPSIDKAAKLYIAERYFKGKWVAGKSGPKNTSGTEATEISKQKDTVAGAGEKNTEGSSGTGEVKGPPSDKGTGTSKETKPGPTGTGGSETKTGSGTGPGN